MEESRKILAQVVPNGNVTQESSTSATNKDVQNVVSPGIAQKIQDRVAQITGKVVERRSGEADKVSLKLLKVSTECSAVMDPL